MVGNTSTSAYSDDGSSYVREIENIYDLGANTIVSSGSNAASSFYGTDDYLGIYDNQKYKDKSVVMIDDDSLCGKNKNAISINFESADAGFIAGVASSIYTIYANENFDKNNSVTVWGGLPFTPVYGFLSGFEQGINWFNYQILGFDLNGEKLDNSLKVDSFKELKSDINKSLELHGSKLNDHLIMDKKIEINNGGDTIIDYTKPPKKFSNDGIHTDPETSFYTGGFSSDPNDQSSGSNAAVKIKNVNSQKGNDSIIFPIAGGQTLEALSNLSNESKTMVIGVDSDAEVASPNYGENILGSATKNVERGANFGTWYSQNLNADIDTQESYVDDTDEHMSAKEFIDEWKIEDESILGSQFTGNFKNGGVGFSDDNSNKVGKILSYYGIGDTTTKNFIENIMIEIFEINNIIEDASETFVVQDEPTHITENKYPWIPDWENKYHN